MSVSGPRKAPTWSLFLLLPPYSFFFLYAPTASLRLPLLVYFLILLATCSSSFLLLNPAGSLLAKISLINLI
eukprot:11044681-Karenia_brevis.AAC.1